jgi:uncharacterized protein (TIGR02147 family)
MTRVSYYQQTLKEELALRIAKNPRYSVRAFAGALGIDPGALSRILNGKQVPSFKISEILLSALDLDLKGREKFLTSIAEKQRNRDITRINPFFREFKKPAPQADLSIDLYRIIADWYHIAILELTYIEGFTFTPEWVSQSLGISRTEAKLAMDRLLQLKLIELKNGEYVKSSEQLSTAHKHLTTPALRKSQKQYIEKAIVSLEEDPTEERNITSMTMAIDPQKLPIAKEMIREFNRHLCEFLETGKRKRVYNLNINLYPLQKRREQK